MRGGLRGGGGADKKWLAERGDSGAGTSSSSEVVLDPEIYNVKVMFVRGWARHGIVDWMILIAGPSSVIDTKKSGLII